MESLTFQRRSRLTTRTINCPHIYLGIVSHDILTFTQNKNNRGATRGRGKRGLRRRNGGGAVGNYFGDAWSLAKRTAVGLNEIRKLINVEQKFKEASASSTYDRSGTVAYLSGLDQGDSTITREGNSIKMQTFRLRYFIKHNANQTSATCHRILIVRDMQNQGATITANDVMESVGVSGAPLAFRDFTNGPLQNKRFAIVYDHQCITHPYKLGVDDAFVTNHDCHIYYRGTDSAVTSAGNGSYFLIALSSDTGADLPTLNYNARMEFTDN